MMTSWHETIFSITGPLLGGSSGHQWILLEKGEWSGELMFHLLLGPTSVKGLNFQGIVFYECVGKWAIILWDDVLPLLVFTQRWIVMKLPYKII